MKSENELGPSEYLFYQLVSRMQSRDDPAQISRTRFYKFACEIDHYLEDEIGRELEFPRYWYQYGEMPDYDTFNLFFLDWEKTSGYSIVKLAQELGLKAFDLDEKLRDDIDTAVAYIVRKFHEYDTPEVVDYHYEKRAPREFVREFNSFRQELEEVDLQQGTLSKYLEGQEVEDTKSRLSNDLEQLVISYPDLYDSMETAFLEWEDTMQMLLEDEEKAEAKALTRQFWQALSRAELRIHHNKDISDEKLNHWKESRQRVVDNVLGEIRDVREDLLSEGVQDSELQTREVVDAVSKIFQKPPSERSARDHLD